MAADSSETHILARFLTHLWPRLKQLEDTSLYSGNATVMSALLDLYGKTLTSAGACQQHVCLRPMCLYERVLCASILIC